LALVKNPRGATNFGSTLKLKDWSIILFSVLALLASIFFRNALFRETVRYSIQGAALAPLFYYSIAMYQNKVFRIFNWGAIKTIGKYSYSIYLVHYILIENMKLFSDFFIVNLLIVFASTFVYVMAIEVFVDRPIRQIRSRYK
jgi:peptidoglycan/LPS O-acetylase OafA/YrhL